MKWLRKASISMEKRLQSFIARSRDGKILKTDSREWWNVFINY